MNLPSPWCTAREAAAYLRWTERTVMDLLVPSDCPAPNRIRVRRVGDTRSVRLVSADVLAMLPKPDLTSPPA